MIRSSILRAALASLTACGVAPAETTSVSAVTTTTDLANFPDGENCTPALDARASEQFESWFAAQRRVQNAMSVDYSGHYVVAWNNGGSYSNVVRAVLQGEAGGLILQIQTYNEDRIYGNELAFFDAAGRHTATVEGVYYFHLDDHTLLVSRAMRDPGDHARSPWLLVREELAAVSLTGEVRWETHVGGHPHGRGWATYHPFSPTWSMYHPRLGVTGRGEESGLFRTRDDKLLWAYYARFSGSPEGGILELDPATGEDLAYESAVTRDRLCALTSTDPDCAAWASEASVRAEWWAFWDPARYDSWEVTGFVPPTDGHSLMVEVATVTFDIAGKRTDQRKLLFYPAEIQYPYRPEVIVDGMYYFHADADTIVASRAMGSSGSYGPSQTPWYSANEYLIGLTATGARRWERPLSGRPAHSAVRGTRLSPTSTLTQLEGGALLWWSFTSADGGWTSLEVLDPVTGGDVPAPTPYARRAACTPAGTPLWRTRAVAPNAPLTRSAPAVTTLTFTGPGTIKDGAFLNVFVDNSRGAFAADVTVSLERNGAVVLPPTRFQDQLDYGAVIEYPLRVPRELRGQPIAGDWTLRVANGNMELSWWMLGVEREVPAPTRYSYTAAATSSAQVSTVNQAISLAAGQTLAIGTCGVYGASFTGDTYLRLIDQAGVQVADNDDACGTGSRLTYTAQRSETLEVRAGCYANDSCNGAVAWTVY